MKANQLATLVLRLLGIYCLIQFVTSFAVTSPAIPILFEMENLSSSEKIVIITTGVFLAFQFAVGILLIVKSVSWGEKLAPQNMSEANITSVSFEQVQLLAFAVAGVLIFSNALPQVLNSFSSFFISISQVADKNRHTGSVQYYDWRMLLSSAGTISKAALGLWMFFGANGFANFWRSARNFGTPKPPEN
jgi:hypothetical protein